MPKRGKRKLSLPRGSYRGPPLALLDADELMYCAMCGRPPRAGEGLGLWRVRAGHEPSRKAPVLWLICPEHYGPGEPPLPDLKGWIDSG